MTSDSEESWSSVVVTAADALFPTAREVGVQVFEHTPDFEFVDLRNHSMRLLHGPAVEAARSATPTLLRRCYYPRTPAVTMLRTVAAEAEMDGLRRQLGVEDMVGVMGHPVSGRVVVLGYVLAEQHELTAHEQHALGVVRGFLEAGHAALAHHGFTSVSVSLDGAVLDASRRVDSVSVWNALASGRYRLHRRLPSHHYVVTENAPLTRPWRRLRSLEERALRLMCAGASGKEVAWRLGTSQTTTSRLLQQGLARLGFANAVDGLRCLLGLLQMPRLASNEALSAAERDVLRLLQAGLSNREIAEERRTAPRTVANQVAALLRKTGAPSRRVLLVHEMA